MTYDAPFRRYGGPKIWEEKEGGAKEELRNSLGGEAKEPVLELGRGLNLKCQLPPWPSGLSLWLCLLRLWVRNPLQLPVLIRTKFRIR